MKNLLKLSAFTLTLLMFLAPSLNAQDNILKTNLVAYSFKTPNLTYERVLEDKMAITLGANFTLGRKRELTGTATTNSGGTQERTAEVKLTGFSVTPGFRLYTGGDAPSGFYLEPFLRYSRLGLLIEDYQYIRDSTNETVLVTGDGSVSGFGGGLNIGAQIVTDMGLTVDFFGGFGGGAGKIKFTVEDDDLLPSEYADIKEEIETELADASVGPVNNLEVTATDSSAEATTNGFLPFFRLGISFGWYF